MRAARALESEQPDQVIKDPYAKKLAGEEGMRLLESYGKSFVLIETIRTKFFDDAILDSLKNGKRQFVVLGAGLDSRPYRFSLPPDVLWFEVDFGSILEYKRRILKDDKPSATPIDVCTDLRNWSCRGCGFEGVGSEERVGMDCGGAYPVPQR